MWDCAQADTKGELDIQRAVKMPPMPGQSRSLLQFNAMGAPNDIADLADFQVPLRRRHFFLFRESPMHESFLKVFNHESFFGSDFEFCTILLIVMLEYLGYVK